MSGTSPQLFIDTGYSQCTKRGQEICGDAISFKRLPEEERFIAVMSDGLGSGVKASILALMTTTMALRFVAEDRDILHSAEIIMDALPICQVRKISYATFTIVDTTLSGRTRVIEMGNPEFMLMRNGQRVMLESRNCDSPKWQDRTLTIYDFTAMPHDRLIFFSDGISQAGLGTQAWPLGWRVAGCQKYVQGLLNINSGISSHDLANCVMREAIAKEPGLVAGDDMTCGVIYFRYPKKLLVFTGPPYDRARDGECAEMVRDFEGAKVICGGTTAEIIGRELGRELVMDLKSIGGDLPPVSSMDGVDLITEGIFTLTKTAQYLERGAGINANDPAGKLVNILLTNDIIEIVVGTRINEAHQDPNLPVDLEIRRNIVKRIAKVLSSKYLKEVKIRFV